MKRKFSLQVISVIVLSVWCQLALTQRCQETDTCGSSYQVNCTNLKYRTMDGSCNNPRKPTLGMAFTSYQRLLPPRYADKIYAIPVAKSGNPLPSARLLSYEFFGRTSIPDPNFSMMNMLWGQAVIHDTSNRISSRSNQLIRALDDKQQTCCNAQRQFTTQTTNATCLPIPVPPGDPFFGSVECLTFDRTVTDKDQKCPGSEDPAPAQQLTGATHYLDLSFVYGNSDAQSKSLRAMSQGLLLTSDHEQKWPPRTSQVPIDPYSPPDPSGITYIFGDGRGNQNPGLVAIHITLLREHNRIARELAALNPHWDDETLFQEARRINIAQYQYITYYEWNVGFYGHLRSLVTKLIHRVHPHEHVNDYNMNIDPRSSQVFQHSSFRFFHNQIMGTFNLASETRAVYNSTITLTSVLGKSGIVEQGCPFSPQERGCQLSSFIRGLSSQAASQFDTNFDPEVAENFPVELRAFDLQRDRDHGLASYNSYRSLCGLRKATTWEDFGDVIPFADINKLRTIYESPDDVDVSIGAALERPTTGSVVGPTFTCINIKQFWMLRVGDLYFFENAKQPYPFTPAQLAEIRKASASRLLCDNGYVQSMQPNAFRKISPINTLRPCSCLPKVDLSLWKESTGNGVCHHHPGYGHFGHGHHHFPGGFRDHFGGFRGPLGDFRGPFRDIRGPFGSFPGHFGGIRGPFGFGFPRG